MNYPRWQKAMRVAQAEIERASIVEVARKEAVESAEKQAVDADNQTALHEAMTTLFGVDAADFTIEGNTVRIGKAIRLVFDTYNNGRVAVSATSSGNKRFIRLNCVYNLDDKTEVADRFEDSVSPSDVESLMGFRTRFVVFFDDLQMRWKALRDNYNAKQKSAELPEWWIQADREAQTAVAAIKAEMRAFLTACDIPNSAVTETTEGFLLYGKWDLYHVPNNEDQHEFIGSWFVCTDLRRNLYTSAFLMASGGPKELTQSADIYRRYLWVAVQSAQRAADQPQKSAEGRLIEALQEIIYEQSTSGY